eukprot:4148544-Amphidinium_carterae.1
MGMEFYSSYVAAHCFEGNSGAISALIPAQIATLMISLYGYKARVRIATTLAILETTSFTYFGQST